MRSKGLLVSTKYIFRMLTELKVIFELSLRLSSAFKFRAFSIHFMKDYRLIPSTEVVPLFLTRFYPQKFPNAPSNENNADSTNHRYTIYFYKNITF